MTSLTLVLLKIQYVYNNRKGVRRTMAYQRKKQHEEDGDFVIGEISGMNDSSEAVNNEQDNNTENGVEQMTKVNPSKVAIPDELVGTVELKLKKEYGRLADIISENNEGVIVQELDNCIQINAPQLKITRQDVDRAIGKVDDGRWRMILLNRQGEISCFNDYEFILGEIQEEIEESKELAQINTRVTAEAKQMMDRTRKKLGDWTQGDFLDNAIRDYVQKVEAEQL